MHYRLTYSFNKLEAQRAEVMALLRESDSAKVSRSVSGKWSPAQIVFHIMISEKLALQYMRKKYLGINASKETGLFESLKFILLKISQRLPLKFKAPKVLGEHDPLNLPLDQLENEWANSRRELAVFLEQFDDHTSAGKFTSIPMRGN